MSYPMPQSWFIWLSEEQWRMFDWLAQTEEQSTRYFVECDLEYPPKLHDSRNDYPLAPERFAVTPSVLSEKQVELARHYSTGVRQKEGKLLPSLLNKAQYVTHYLNLKFFIQLGRKLTKIQGSIQFQ